jgi:hypothetical protein
VNDGTVIEFVRLRHFGGDGLSVALCVEPGDEAGVVDRESGEYLVVVEEEHRLLGSHIALVEIEEGRIDWRVVASGAPSDVDCP